MAGIPCLITGAARLPGFHVCVGSGGERLAPEWYKEKGNMTICFCGIHFKWGSLIVMNPECATVRACILAILLGIDCIRFSKCCSSFFDSFEKHNLVYFPLLMRACEVEDNFIGQTILPFLIFFMNDKTLAFQSNTSDSIASCVLPVVSSLLADDTLFLEANFV